VLPECVRDLGPPTPGETSLGRPWSILSLIVCEDICGRYEHALPSAAALQLLRSAAEIFDDLEDADKPASIPARYGPARAINIATGLIMLAEQSLTRLAARGVAADTALSVIESVNRSYLTACAGQHLDLAATSPGAISEEQYLKIAAMRSASPVECACRAGALLAGAAPGLAAKAGDYGRHIGLSAQIANDIGGINDGRDIVSRKITLPTIFALSQADSQVQIALRDRFFNQPQPETDWKQIRELLFRSGAMHYALLKMEYFLQLARDSLAAIEAERGPMKRMRAFLDWPKGKDELLS